MIKKRSKFWTVLFSFLPGAGHMFMGFMKQGISFMSMFFFVIFLASWLNISPLMFVLPILWFYSFFDAINKMSLSDEEFYGLEDYFVLSIDKIFIFENAFFKRRKIFLGVVILVLGIYFLWNNIWHNLQSLFPDYVNNVISEISDIVPQLMLGVIILVIGVRLISSKKKESGAND